MMKRSILSFSFYVMMFALLSSCNNNVQQDNTKDTGAKKVTINFDSSTIKCESALSSGSEVDDGTTLKFTALPPNNKKVKEWQVNDKTIPGENKIQFTFKVDAKKAKEVGKKRIVKVSVVFEEQTNEDGDAYLIFDINKMTAQRKGSFLESNATVKENDEIFFVKKTLRGKKFVKWSINGNGKDDQSSASFTYIVKKSDVLNGAITIDWVAEDLKAFYLDFDATLIECKLALVKLNKGDVAYLGEGLSFNAIALKEGEEVLDWLVKGKVASLTQGVKSFYYVVKEKDGEDVGGKLTIKVSYTLKETIKIEYGNDIKSCKASDGWFGTKDIPSGSVLAIGNTLTFTANLDEGEGVEEWKINDVVQNAQKEKTFSYKVKKEDAKQGVIKVSIKKTTLKSTVLKFDKAKVKCLKNYKPVEPETIIYEGEKFIFKALLQEGKGLKCWKVNDTEKTEANKLNWEYVFKLSDAIGEPKAVTISYTETTLPKHHIVFDPAKVKAEKRDTDPPVQISNNEEIYEGVTLRFTAILQTGQTLNAWRINEQPQDFQVGTVFIYTCAASNAVLQGGKSQIKIDYTLKKTLKIKFNDQDISCTKPSGIWSSEPVLNGSDVIEGTSLTFTAKNLNAGETVEKWTVNALAQPNTMGQKTFKYTVKGEDASSAGEITVAIEKRALEKFYISFDPEKMTCTKNKVPVENGGEINEGDSIKFDAKVNKGDQISAWLVKAVKQKGWSGYAYFTYTVKKDDCEVVGGKNTIKVDYVLYPNRVKIIFDENLISCKYDGWTFIGEIKSGEFVLAGNEIKFTAKLKDGQKVKSWVRNGLVISNGVKNTYNYTVIMADATGEDGKKEITVSVNIE